MKQISEKSPVTQILLLFDRRLHFLSSKILFCQWFSERRSCFSRVFSRCVFYFFDDDQGTADLGSRKIELWIGRNTARVDGSYVLIDPANVAQLERPLLDLAGSTAVALIGIGGRHLDDGAPLVDVRWEHGTRVHAVLPPIACSGAAISIRLPSADVPDLDELGRRGMFDRVTGARLEALVAERANLLVTGATGAGKTTLLAALLGRVPAGERIVTIEDVAELRVAHPHHVRLEARQPNLEGAGAVTLARLVREALRMRPDRLVVGECRGDEVRELLMALNTGHAGGAGTVHAGGIREVPARLEALGALAGLDDHGLARQVVSAIGVIIHVERGSDGVRRIVGFARPVLIDGRLGVEAMT